MFSALVFASLLFGCIGQSPAQATPTPEATLEPSATAIATPLPTATIQPTPLATTTSEPTSQPSVQTSDGLADIKAGLETATNTFLEQKGSSDRISMTKLSATVAGLNQITREYYEGEVFTTVSENGVSKTMKIRLHLQEIFKGEYYEKGYTPSGERTVAGRLMKYSSGISSTPSKTGLYCQNGKYYAYVEYSGTTTIPIDDLFSALVPACPE